MKRYWIIDRDYKRSGGKLERVSKHDDYTEALISWGRMRSSKRSTAFLARVQVQPDGREQVTTLKCK